MRGIRFRGKRVYNGEWTEGYYVCVWGMHLIFTGQIAIDMEDEDAENRIVNHEVLPETVGQYTGLTDKNGKKIFEGDIVMFSRTRNLPNVIPVPEVIRYHKGDCAFQRFPFNISLTVGGGGKLLQPDMMCECEVIGNIYDNPELLKGGE